MYADSAIDEQLGELEWPVVLIVQSEESAHFVQRVVARGGVHRSRIKTAQQRRHERHQLFDDDILGRLLVGLDVVSVVCVVDAVFKEAQQIEQHTRLKRHIITQFKSYHEHDAGRSLLSMCRLFKCGCGV